MSTIIHYYRNPGKKAIIGLEPETNGGVMEVPRSAYKLSALFQKKRPVVSRLAITERVSGPLSSEFCFY